MKRGFLALALGLVAASSARARAPCEKDAGLSAAAEALLREEGPPEAGRIDDALHAVGSDLPHASALWLPRAHPERRRRWLRSLRERTDVPLVCGVARSGGGVVLHLASPRAGGLRLRSRNPLRFAGWLHSAFERPRLYFMGSGGRLCRRSATREQLARGVEACLRSASDLRVQLVGSGPRGPRPVARWRDEEVGAADGNAAFSALPVVQGESLSEALQTLRRHAGSRALRSNRLLRAVATRHARHSCEQGRIAHMLQPGEDPEARLNREGIRARAVGEVAARAADPRAAFAAIQHSPSHRWTLLERRFTDVGIGSARDARGRACLVILFAAWPRAF